MKKLLFALISGSLLALIVAGAALAQPAPAGAQAAAAAPADAPGGPTRGGRPQAAGNISAGAAFDGPWFSSKAGQDALSVYRQRFQVAAQRNPNRAAGSNAAVVKQARMTMASSMYFAEKNATQPHYNRYRGNKH